jgi:hypothetical protein
VTPAQFDVFIHATHRPKNAVDGGFLVCRMHGGIVPRAPFHATGPSGEVLMRRLPGRVVLGLLVRGWIRPGPEIEIDGAKWTKLVPTQRGMLAMMTVGTGAA